MHPQHADHGGDRDREERPGQPEQLAAAEDRDDDPERREPDVLF
jgi:hypothetical protein